MSAVRDDAHQSWNVFWDACLQLIEIYPNRPPTISGESEAKQIERRLKSLALELIPQLVANDYWLTEASVGTGNWAAMPWVSIFDTRESTSAQQGVYPVIHLAPDSPAGIRIGLGVSATEFKSCEDEKAAEVWQQLTDNERQSLVDAGFQDVVHGSQPRTEIGAGNLARKYAKGMVFERIADFKTIQKNSLALTGALQVLLDAYKNWVDRKASLPSLSPAKDFLEQMRTYAAERVVFMSPKRDARYVVAEVTDTHCLINRLDSDKPETVTASGFCASRDWLREQGGDASREALDGTVAKHMCYLQSDEMILASDRKIAVLLDDLAKTSQVLIELVRSMQTTTLYKPVILALVIEGIRDRELEHNHFEFDWLLPRFIERLNEHGHADVGEQQLAEGFARMANDLFWLHAYRDPIELVPLDRPTASLIRDRISHARLHSGFWNAVRKPECQKAILEAIAEKWWPDVKPPDSNSNFQQSMEQLVDAIAGKGFIFHPWQIATYVTALRTKPFVILAGISGTGKSKLPELVSQLTDGNCVRVSVRPDWTDSSEVLGYIDLNDRFRPGRVLQFVNEAEQDSDRYHVCLVDEMNLARVEHYFAEVLSAIEDRQRSPRGGFQSTSIIAQKLPEEYKTWQEQVIPPNLGIVGTVNMDESSHGFSRKVLDRAFTLELSEVDLSLDSNTPSDSSVDHVDWSPKYWTCTATRISELDLTSQANRILAERATSLLQEINRSLVHCQLQVGYRTRDEVILFMINADEIRNLFRTRSGETVDPLDLAVMMKILPRLVGGSNALRQSLMGLLGVALTGQSTGSEEEIAATVDEWVSNGRADLVIGAKLPRSAARLCLMWKRLEDGYTSYWL